MTTDRPSWQLLLDRIEREPDPRRKANLDIVARHVVLEVAGDVPALMTTLVAEPVYNFRGVTDTPAAHGATAVRAHYETLIATGRNRLDYHITRVVVDDDHVVTDGDFHFAYPAADTGEDWNLVAVHCLIVWPIDESGLIEGEEIYAAEPPRVIRRLMPGELPNLGPLSRAGGGRAT